MRPLRARTDPPGDDHPAEVDTLGGAVPRMKELARLEHCQRVFKEALRLYPPVPFYEREAIEPHELGGVAIPSGTYLVVFPWALHHRAE